MCTKNHRCFVDVSTLYLQSVMLVESPTIGRYWARLLEIPESTDVLSVSLVESSEDIDTVLNLLFFTT